MITIEFRRTIFKKTNKIEYGLFMYLNANIYIISLPDLPMKMVNSIVQHFIHGINETGHRLLTHKIWRNDEDILVSTFVIKSIELNVHTLYLIEHE